MAAGVSRRVFWGISWEPPEVSDPERMSETRRAGGGSRFVWKGPEPGGVSSTNVFPLLRLMHFQFFIQTEKFPD